MIGRYLHNTLDLAFSIGRRVFFNYAKQKAHAKIYNGYWTHTIVVCYHNYLHRYICFSSSSTPTYLSLSPSRQNTHPLYTCTAYAIFQDRPVRSVWHFDSVLVVIAPGLQPNLVLLEDHQMVRPGHPLARYYESHWRMQRGHLISRI